MLLTILTVIALTLPMKVVETVDTVGYEKVCDGLSWYRTYVCDTCLGGYINISGCDSVWSPILNTTADTTYYLTPEQIKLLELFETLLPKEVNLGFIQDTLTAGINWEKLQKDAEKAIKEISITKPKKGN